MYLIVDFLDLRLDYTKTDIHFDEESADYSVEKLIKELCKGVETLGGKSIHQKEEICLFDPDGNWVNPDVKVSELCRRNWKDWDTIYLSRRR